MALKLPTALGPEWVAGIVSRLVADCGAKPAPTRRAILRAIRCGRAGRRFVAYDYALALATASGVQGQFYLERLAGSLAAAYEMGRAAASP